MYNYQCVAFNFLPACGFNIADPLILYIHTPGIATLLSVTVLPITGVRDPGRVRKLMLSPALNPTWAYDVSLVSCLSHPISPSAYNNIAKVSVLFVTRTH